MKKGAVIGMGFLITVVLGLTFLMPGHTDVIVDSNGEKIVGSIAKMEEIKLGGVDQWIVMRGEDKTKPVLLMLSGGPGASEMGRFIEYNKNLEDNFVVVNWEQRGCGKSYPAIKNEEDIKVEQYVEDINELTEYLKTRFSKEKIYLLGHSWGTIIGTMAIQKYPDNYHAYIGAAQMVNVRKTDEYMYDFVMKSAKKYGDNKRVEKMIEYGKPPYYGDNILKRYKPFLTTYAQYYRKENPYHEKNREWYNPTSVLFIPEYTAYDKVRLVKGMLNTFEIVYQQLQEFDFTKEATELEVPVYYMMGRHDYTAKFIDEYFKKIKAPEKKLYWFENSAHGQIWSEPDKFHDIMVDVVLKKQ
ncbi:MAG: alpha/beta fold hydrolase [Fusobacteriota bacterium]